MFREEHDSCFTPRLTRETVTGVPLDETEAEAEAEEEDDDDEEDANGDGFDEWRSMIRPP